MTLNTSSEKRRDELQEGGEVLLPEVILIKDYKGAYICTDKSFIINTAIFH